MAWCVPVSNVLYEYAVLVRYSYSVDHFWLGRCGLYCVFVLGWSDGYFTTMVLVYRDICTNCNVYCLCHWVDISHFLHVIRMNCACINVPCVVRVLCAGLLRCNFFSCDRPNSILVLFFSRRLFNMYVFSIFVRRREHWNMYFWILCPHCGLLSVYISSQILLYIWIVFGCWVCEYGVCCDVVCIVWYYV